MTIKEKYENLKSLLNLYGLNMKIHNGHVTFTDIKTGIVLETYYKEDEYDYSEDAKEVKTASVKDLLGQASRIFHAVLKLITLSQYQLTDSKLIKTDLLNLILKKTNH